MILIFKRSKGFFWLSNEGGPTSPHYLSCDSLLVSQYRIFSLFTSLYTFPFYFSPPPLSPSQHLGHTATGLMSASSKGNCEFIWEQQTEEMQGISSIFPSVTMFTNPTSLKDRMNPKCEEDFGGLHSLYQNYTFSFSVEFESNRLFKKSPICLNSILNGRSG